MDYVIESLEYRNNSAGIRSLHCLCHHLRKRGYAAYVTGKQTNPDWDEVSADPEMVKRIARDGIAVYPEGILGNKFCAARVVRFVLNQPGYIGGYKDYDPSEWVWCYTGMLQKFVPQSRGVLRTPIIEQDIFRDTHQERRGRLLWIGRGRGKALDEIEIDTYTQIEPGWPPTRLELAGLFQRAELFVSLYPFTELITEARLCGCPTAVIPNEQFTRGDFAVDRPGVCGLAWGIGDKELEWARQTVGQFGPKYMDLVKQFETQLTDFIYQTQNWQQESWRKPRENQ